MNWRKNLRAHTVTSATANTSDARERTAGRKGEIEELRSGTSGLERSGQGVVGYRWGTETRHLRIDEVSLTGVGRELEIPVLWVSCKD